MGGRPVREPVARSPVLTAAFFERNARRQKSRSEWTQSTTLKRRICNYRSHCDLKCSESLSPPRVAFQGWTGKPLFESDTHASAHERRSVWCPVGPSSARRNAILVLSRASPLPRVRYRRFTANGGNRESPVCPSRIAR